jgi:hypothetical protein
MQNAMISNIVHVTNIPRRTVIKWFEEKMTDLDITLAEFLQSFWAYIASNPGHIWTNLSLLNFDNIMNRPVIQVSIIAIHINCFGAKDAHCLTK